MATKFKGIRTAAEYKRGELTKDILRLVGAGVVIGGATIVAPNALQLIDYFNPRGHAERNKIWKAIKYLEEKQYVELENNKGDMYVTMTDKGRIKLSEDAIWELEVQKPRRWDRKWRLVMFDLPSRHDNIRQSFRLKLEDFGFRMYQRSVFIYPYECYTEVNVVAKWYGVHNFVRYIVATEINDVRVFAKLFDLL